MDTAVGGNAVDSLRSTAATRSTIWAEYIYAERHSRLFLSPSYAWHLLVPFHINDTTFLLNTIRPAMFAAEATMDTLNRKSSNKDTGLKRTPTAGRGNDGGPVGRELV